MADSFLSSALYIINGIPLFNLMDIADGWISPREAYNLTIDFQGP